MFWYVQIAGVIVGILFHLTHSFKNYSKGGTFWHNQNLIINGKLSWLNVFRVTLFCLVLFMCQNMAYLTIWAAEQAQMNVGVVTCIWTVDPIVTTVYDFVVYGQRL